MRLSACYRVIKFAGYFWGPQFFNYRYRFAGYRAPTGLGRRFRLYARTLADGQWLQGSAERTSTVARRAGLPSLIFRGRGRPLQLLPLLRLRHMACGLLRLGSSSLSPLWPWAWAILRYLRVRAYRGWRYRRALPARGGRTHTNASTVGRVKDGASRLIRGARWVRRIWEAQKRRAVLPRTHAKTTSKRALKAVRYKRGVVRVKKKLDVWR